MQIALVAITAACIAGVAEADLPIHALSRQRTRGRRADGVRRRHAQYELGESESKRFGRPLRAHQMLQDGRDAHSAGLDIQKKESPADAEGAFVLTGHGYGLPNLPVPSEASPFGHRYGSWVAKRNQFSDTSPQELAMYKGHMGYQKFHKQMEYALPTFLQKDASSTLKPAHDKPYACDIPLALTAQTSAAPLPAEWTWGDPFLSENYDPASDPVVNQKNCGSCYAVSSAFVLQRRFEILFSSLFPDNKETLFSSPLSAQTVLSCSPFNQGCDGGYPFLVGKHAMEFGIGLESCQSYRATHQPEEAPCPMHIGNFLRSPEVSEPQCGPEDRWYAQDYNYVGGFYEGCDEAKIMEEIYNHGPVVAAIDAPDALFLYDDGFFDSKPSDHGKLCDSPKKGFTGWEYTNHAISIVGWGEDPPRMPGMAARKFWVVRNTWGNTWGRNGYVKMKRGENLAAIESQAVAIDPDLKRGRAAALIRTIRMQNNDIYLANREANPRCVQKGQRKQMERQSDYRLENKRRPLTLQQLTIQVKFYQHETPQPPKSENRKVESSPISREVAAAEWVPPPFTSAIK
ncbi:hypothetical protein Efla_006473 [Eimeria flavescens]